MAQHIANYQSPRTIKLYDRRAQKNSQSDVDKIWL